MTTWKSSSAFLAAALVACTSTAPSPEPIDTEPTLTPADADPAEPGWRALADAPTRRLEVAAAVVDGELWIAGGLVPGGATGVVEVYDPQQDRWRTGPPLPVEVHHAMGVAWRDSFVVAGGFVGGGFGRASDRVFRLADDGWMELPRLGRARGAGGAVAIDDQIILIGGQAGGSLIAATERFDGSSWSDAAPLPTPRDHLGVAGDGRFAYAVVGRGLAIDATVTRLERYDPRDDVWRRLPDASTARGGVGAAVVGDRLVVVGGEGSAGNPDGVFPQAEAFVIGERRWETLPPMPTPRHGLGVGVIDARMLVAVGGPSIGLSVSSILEELVLP